MWNFTSDCLKAAPDIFLEQLASLFRSCLLNGHLSKELLVCALCPIVKDPNADISSSKNYRGIAISSLILKVLDNCILLLFGSLLSNDELQLGFQEGCSTVQGTWAVQETVSYYLRNNSEVFCCILDFSKAFDKVNFDSLPKTPWQELPSLFEAHHLYLQPPILLHKMELYWELSLWGKDGVRQAAILSPVLRLPWQSSGILVLVATLVGYILEPSDMLMMLPSLHPPDRLFRVYWTYVRTMPPHTQCSLAQIQIRPRARQSVSEKGALRW